MAAMLPRSSPVDCQIGYAFALQTGRSHPSSEGTIVIGHLLGALAALIGASLGCKATRWPLT